MIALAAFFTAVMSAVGYWSLGLGTMVIVTSGFATGLVLFALRPRIVPFGSIRWQYFLTLALFAVHRAEEYFSGFFDALAVITGVAKPDVGSLPVLALVALSVGAWLLVPLLCGRSRFGTYLAFTFFSAMAITELAHIIVFPLLVGRPFDYFPGMASVFLLAPVAWWGLVSLWRQAKAAH